MNLKLASFISTVLNPLFILIFLPFLLVYKSTNNIFLGLWWTGYTFLYLLVLGLFMLFAVHRKIFTDLDVSRREQRPLVFSFALGLAVFYISGLYVLNSPNILKIMALGISFGIFVLSLVNIKIKASIHMATFSGLLLGLALGYGGLFYLLFLFIPILAKARVSLKRHTLSEVVTGGFLGSLISLGIYLILKYL